MIAEYAQEFIRLEKYAHHMIHTEADRVERFRARLIQQIYNAMIAIDFPSLTILVDKVKQFENRCNKEKKEKE